MSEHALGGVHAAAPAHGRPSWGAAAWRQYRLERRMFWRNPTAFFGFLLPLLLLAMFGAVFSGEQEQLDVVVPGIMRHERDGGDVRGARLQPHLPARARDPEARLRGTPLSSSAYLAGIAANAVANTVVQVAVVIVASPPLLRHRVVNRLARTARLPRARCRLLRVAGRGALARDPELRVRLAFVNAVFLPMIMLAGVFYDDEDMRRCCATSPSSPLKHLIDGLSGAMVDGEGLTQNVTALAMLGLWAAVGIFFAVRGFSWEARRS